MKSESPSRLSAECIANDQDGIAMPVGFPRIWLDYLWQPLSEHATLTTAHGAIEPTRPKTDVNHGALPRQVAKDATVAAVNTGGASATSRAAGGHCYGVHCKHYDVVLPRNALKAEGRRIGEYDRQRAG